MKVQRFKELHIGAPDLLKCHAFRDGRRSSLGPVEELTCKELGFFWVSVKMGYTPKLPFFFLFNGEDVDNPLGVVYFQTKPQKQPRNRNHNVFEKQLGKSKPILVPASYLGFEPSISDYFRRVLQS